VLQECPQLKSDIGGNIFLARGNFCVTAGELTEVMIKEYLAHHFQGKDKDDFDFE